MAPRQHDLRHGFQQVLRRNRVHLACPVCAVREEILGGRGAKNLFLELRGTPIHHEKDLVLASGRIHAGQAVVAWAAQRIPAAREQPARELFRRLEDEPDEFSWCQSPRALLLLHLCVERECYHR